jgi:hypothetical protein
VIYLLSVYSGESPPGGPPRGRSDHFEAACRAYARALQQRGFLLAVLSAPPGPVGVLWLQDRRLLLDAAAPATGPGAIVEFYLLTARALNEALRLAAEMPQACRGPLEIRPLELRYWAPPPG